MAELIGAYELTSALSNNNAGNCRWAFGKRGDQAYFIKELLVPIYPLDNQGLSDAMVNRKRKICENFENERRLVFRRLNESSDGNLIRIESFFRFGSRYYVVTKKMIDQSVDALRGVSFEGRLLICRVLAHALSGMHRGGLVHGDLKLSNIMIIRTDAGRLSAKIIDVDGAYWHVDPPKDAESVMTDQVYMAPEVFLFLRDEEGAVGAPADVFSLALCMHRLLTDEAPLHGDYPYAFQAVLDGCPLQLSGAIPAWLQQVLLAMLQASPEDRPSMDLVFDALTKRDASCLMPEPGPETEPTVVEKAPVVAPPEVKEPPAVEPPRVPAVPTGGSKLKINWGSKGLSEAIAEAAPPPESAGGWFGPPSDL